MTTALEKPVPQHVTRLAAANIMRIAAVDLVFDPKTRIVTIRGENAQGKSSLLACIALALGGKRIQPPEVIRAGQDQAFVLLETEDLIVERRWTSNTHSTLEVHSRNGEKFKSPQHLLDGLVSRVSFDPLHFLKLDRDAQAETLRKLIGIDFRELDGKRLKIFDDRTFENRVLDGLKKRLAALPPANDNAPAPVDVSKLLEQQATLSKAAFERQNVVAKVEAAQKLVEDRERLVKDAEAQLRAAYQRKTEAQTLLTAAREQLAALPPPPAEGAAEAIARQIASASEASAQRAKQAERAQLAEQLEAQEAKVKGMTDSLDAIDAEKAQLTKAAKFPVPGLGFGTLGVTFDGLPFEQASGAQKLRVSTAIGFALNPGLKVLRLADAPYLDAKSLALLAELAEAADGQVFLEAGGNEGVGIVIEDGTVAAINGGVAEIYNARTGGSL